MSLQVGTHLVTTILLVIIAFSKEPRAGTDLRNGKPAFSFTEILHGPARRRRIFEDEHDCLQGLSQTHDICKNTPAGATCKAKQTA